MQQDFHDFFTQGETRRNRGQNRKESEAISAYWGRIEEFEGPSKRQHTNRASPASDLGRYVNFPRPKAPKLE
jgi:hypothetical protein